MVWSLAHDDYAKKCKSSSRPYPLISTIHDVLTAAEKGEPMTRYIPIINPTKEETTRPTTKRPTLPANTDNGRSLFKSCLLLSNRV